MHLSNDPLKLLLIEVLHSLNAYCKIKNALLTPKNLRSDTNLAWTKWRVGLHVAN